MCVGLDYHYHERGELHTAFLLSTYQCDEQMHHKLEQKPVSQVECLSLAIVSRLDAIVAVE